VTRAQWRALLLLAAAALIALAGVALWLSPAPRAAEPRDRPDLLLLTSLPLVFGEQFSIDGGGSPALDALRRHYRVIPIDVTDARQLARGRLLLLAQPRPQRPEDLVALDRWVRAGGRLVLLADPMLEWPSARPLGDPLRPPAMFTDTGLLQHWDLRLDAPDERGPALRKLGDEDVLTVSPGALSGGCPISADRLVARCAIGRGKATVVADADLLDVQHLDGPGSNNLNGLIEELATLHAK
jgi:hypothetical protein